MRINLNCPYSEKDQVKALGARWDASRKVWYIVDVENLTPFLRWLPKDRQKKKRPVETGAAFRPLCSCTTPPWEDCEHTQGLLEGEALSHLRDIMAEA